MVARVAVIVTDIILHTFTVYLFEDDYTFSNWQKRKNPRT